MLAYWCGLYLPQTQGLTDPSFRRYLWSIRLPFWLPAVIIGLLVALLLLRDSRRVRPGCCLCCGYDLTGNVSGRCPECGRAISTEVERTHNA
jgi:hypothetical protein